MPRDNWVNNVSKSEYLVSLQCLRRRLPCQGLIVAQYDTSAPTTSRDVVFKAINDLVASQFKSKQGLIGLAPWSYGGIYRSHTQRYNNQGILLAGDPPQEREWEKQEYLVLTSTAADFTVSQHRAGSAFSTQTTPWISYTRCTETSKPLSRQQLDPAHSSICTI